MDRPTPLTPTSIRVCLACCLAAAALAGCSSTRWVSLREVPHSPLVWRLKLTASGGPRPSDRAMQLLRVYNLAGEVGGDPRTLVEKFQTIADREPSAEKTYALAELTYIGGKRSQASDERSARDLYGASVLHAYRYLFDVRFSEWRNPYDPQFRGACDLYNGALEAALRIENRDKSLLPGRTVTMQTSAGPCDVTCVLRGGAWSEQDFERFDFVSDYEIKGLKNHYQSYGLGVPLIAVRKSYAGEPPAARYYPPGLSFPVTAFLRPKALPVDGGRRRAELELYDPLSTRDIDAAPVRIPLESDLTTPLAYFLSEVRMDDLATAGLLNPEKLLKAGLQASRPLMGLYMVQPYEAGKIPVLMVHGLWSSPMTWMEMFNDLRSSEEIRRRYQFWFYLYPTGQPFWISAAQMRADLAALRETLDPQRRQPALDQMILVGHSMGGLVSRLQTIDSGDDYWNAASRQPIQLVKAEGEVREKLEQCFYFRPSPSIRRVITLGTPHRGSSFSNQTTQWLLSKFIELPKSLMQNQQQLFRENPDAFIEPSLLKVQTSIDSLAPASPVFPVMLSSQKAPWVKYHNIIGLVPGEGWFGRWAAGSDGVVTLESARMDDVESELIVPADHTTVHSHPLAVLEVRRILLEHLDELEAGPKTPSHVRVTRR